MLCWIARCPALPSFDVTLGAECSPDGDGLHLGALLVRDHPGQLQPRSRACSSYLYTFTCLTFVWALQVNFFVGSTGLGQLARIWQYVFYFTISNGVLSDGVSSFISYNRTGKDPVQEMFSASAPSLTAKA